METQPTMTFSRQSMTLTVGKPNFALVVISRLNIKSYFIFLHSLVLVVVYFIYKNEIAKFQHSLCGSSVSHFLWRFTAWNSPLAMLGKHGRQRTSHLQIHRSWYYSILDQRGSLVRLLATKSDVLTAFRKRLMRAAALKSKLVTGQSSDELEVAIYSGDVQA